MHLHLQNVGIGYSDKIVAEDISVSLHQGQMACLLGRNGIGKSTLLRSIAAFQPVLGGDILVDNKNLSDYSRQELARTIGVVLTDRPENMNMSVRELVCLGRSPYTGFFGTLSEEDNSIVDDAIRMVGIENLAERSLSTLSDGERQKAMIAKTLAQQTPIILLDEPTAFLDFQSKIELLRLLQRLAHEEQKTILLSTHELQLALKMADELWLFMDDGRLEDYSTPLPDDVLADLIGQDCLEYI